MKEDKIEAEATKLIRVHKKAAGYAEFNKLRTDKSVVDYVSEAIVEKWERENVGKVLKFSGDKVLGMEDK